MKKKIRNILMLIFFVSFLVSAWHVYNIKKDYKAGSESYASLEQYISFEDTEPTIATNEVPATLHTEPTETVSTISDDTKWPNINFAALSEINQDIVGWLYIEGTEINYPVVQGTDNDYYLRHLFDGTYNNAGCLFLDSTSESDFTEKNNIIYGHHMKNGTMFYDLKEYKDQSFYDEHAVALLVTPTNKYKIHFFSGYVSATSASAWDIDFSDVGYELWLQELLDKSCFTAVVQPTTEDLVITLSTCSYEFNNARFVLHGILQDNEAELATETD